ncbi:hypothetical protein ACF0H5_019718 [Mactra antiquata]
MSGPGLFKMVENYCFTGIISVLILTAQCKGNDDKTIANGAEDVSVTLPLSKTIPVQDIPNENARHFLNIIYILNELQYFNVGNDKPGCFSLSRIERIVRSTPINSKQIGIHFYFEETSRNASANLDNELKSLDSDRSNTFVGGECETIPNTFLDNVDLPKLSRKQEDGNINDENALKDNETDTVFAGIPSKDKEQGEEDDKAKGLSRTQVIVIATCSAVIGTFFIIAGAMRIHSCLKRYRENRDNVFGIARRTRGFADPGSIRRESEASKASRQSQPASKAGSDSQINRNGRSPPSPSQNTPQHCSDQKQLLPMHADGQCSDGSSSHGSLAYIDEETCSKLKAGSNNSGSEYGSEDDPLLRKSPDSGSSVDVNLGDDDDEEKNECITSQYTGVTSCEPTSTSSRTDDNSGSREDASETCSEINNYNCVNESLKEDTIPLENISIVEAGRITDLNTGNPDSSVLDKAEAKFTEAEKARSMSVDETISNTRPSDADNVTKDGNIQKPKTIASTGNKKLPKKQFSVDYFEVDDNGIEIINPIFEESCEELDHMENMAVSIGLTQSDSSLSNNPSYNYGNQTGYEMEPGYGNYGYCNPYSYNMDNSTPLNGPDLIRATLRNSVLLSADSLQRANGNNAAAVDSLEDSYHNDLMRRQSLNDEYNRNKVSRMLSTDSYFTQAKRPLQAEYSSPPADAVPESTANPVKLHIVPLAEYHHRNSLKESVEEENV